MSGPNRRDFLQVAGLTGMGWSTAFAQGGPSPGLSGAGTVDEANTSRPEITPTHHVRFAAIGLDHAHIYGMTRAIQRGGGELVSFFSADPAQVAQYRAVP
jgi:hypothetical protein